MWHATQHPQATDTCMWACTCHVCPERVLMAAHSTLQVAGLQPAKGLAFQHQPADFTSEAVSRRRVCDMNAYIQSHDDCSVPPVVAC